jgi:cell division protein FtsA
VQAEKMKIQFGSALSDETKSNTFITIPGLRGMAAKEISVKTLASIIQARMSEILDFVAYHLKQVGLDNKMLNGGVILTGGGSQLKHLLQLTEYITGMNARVGLPNEHLAGGHIEELAKPMYSTCIGLILKGYNDFENRGGKMDANFIKAEVLENGDEPSAPVINKLMKQEEVSIESQLASETGEKSGPLNVNNRQKLKKFLDSIKVNIIEIFKEEEDPKL